MFERKSLSLLSQWEESAQVVMTPEIKSTINTHSIWAAIVCFLPLFGFESILYVMILWDMYQSIAKKVGMPFSFKAIVGGVIINVLISIVSGLFDWLFGIAWIISAALMYYLTYVSGETYLGLLFKEFKARNTQSSKNQINELQGSSQYYQSIPPPIPPDVPKSHKPKKSVILFALSATAFFLCKWWAASTDYVVTKHDFIFGDYNSKPVSNCFAELGVLIFGLTTAITAIVLIVRLVSWGKEKRTK